jgi:hypothetical protein
MPSGFGHVDTIVPGCSFDIAERLFALVVGDVLDLVEAGDGVTDVRRVVQGLLALVGEGIDRGGEVAAFFGVECFVVFVMLPGCFHAVPSRFLIVLACSCLTKAKM